MPRFIETRDTWKQNRLYPIAAAGLEHLGPGLEFIGETVKRVIAGIVRRQQDPFDAEPVEGGDGAVQVIIVDALPRRLAGAPQHLRLLAACPIRVANLESIEIGRHLIQDTNGFRLVFPGVEVKNRRPLDFPLPDKLDEPISRYLSLCRPYLLGYRGRRRHEDPGQALWISKYGTALKRVTIWSLISRRTRARFGSSIYPQLFRDCAATSIAIELPDQVGIIQPVLGHNNPATGQKHYNQARSIDAARRFQSTIETLMGEPS